MNASSGRAPETRRGRRPPTSSGDPSRNTLRGHPALAPVFAASLRATFLRAASLRAVSLLAVFVLAAAVFAASGFAVSVFAGPGFAAPGFTGPDRAPPAASGAQEREWESEEVRRAFYGLVDRNRVEQERAAAFLAARGDRDAIPAMVDALRYDPFRNPALVAALEELGGLELGERYEPWAEWMVREGLRGPAGYRRWKADLLSRLHPRFGEFLDPSRPSEIAYEEIRWGGVPPEGIPSLDDPATVPATRVDWLDDGELVFAATVEGASRAYPLRILDWHEMTNDTLGGVPVALSYCTLCGSGILFDRRIGERTFTFATSGLLYRSNKLMFDRETGTLWSNLTGRPVVGPLVEAVGPQDDAQGGEGPRGGDVPGGDAGPRGNVGRPGDDGLQLEVLPVVVTTWGEWRAGNPDGTVLGLETGYERDYRPGRPYGEYFASPDTMFPVGVRDDRLPAKAWVFGMRVEGQAMAFELEAVRRAGVANVVVGDRPVVLVAGAGRAVRAFARDDAAGDTLDFRSHPGQAGKLLDGAGRAWTISDIALLADDRSGRLERLPGHLAYWFGWYAFFPDTRLWTGSR